MFEALIVSLLLAAQSSPIQQHWNVDGLQREALVALPSAVAETPAPVVFVFHGHGGRAQRVAQSFDLHTHWPEAIVVYPQGVPTPGRLTDPEGKRNGWQHAPGEQNDRDLKFFDVLLDWLRSEHNIDESRIYCTGHSNGGGFTYLLWQQRPDLFAAIAPSSAGTRRKGEPKPLPIMHIAGRADPLVKFDRQERTMKVIRRLNACEEQGTEWAKNATLYPSAGGTPFVAVIHDGGHKFYRESVPLMVRFFKEHQRTKARRGRQPPDSN